MLKKLILGFIAVFVLVPTLSLAADNKMVIQVSSKDKIHQKMALLNAKNLKTTLGNDAVDVEIVVFGPGLGLLKTSSWSADRVTDLMSKYGVKVSVCEGTLKAYAKRHDGKMPELVAGATKVKTGALRIMQLQQQGYAYLRP